MPWTPQATHFLWQTTPQKSEHPLILHIHNNSKNTKDRERITPDQYPKRNWLHQTFSTPLWKSKSLMQILETQICFLNLKMSKNVSLFFRSVKHVEDVKLWCIKSSWSLRLCCVLGLGFVMGFRIFVRLVLILKQSLFQSVSKIKVFFPCKGKTTD